MHKQGCNGLTAAHLGNTETVSQWTVDIQHSKQTTVVKEWYHNLGPRRRITGDVAGKGMDVGNNDGASLRSRCPADAAADGDADAGGLAIEWTKNELGTIEQIKPNPVYIIECVIQQRRCIGQVGNGISFASDKTPNLTNDMRRAFFVGQARNVRNHKHVHLNDWLALAPDDKWRSVRTIQCLDHQRVRAGRQTAHIKVSAVYAVSIRPFQRGGA